MQLALSTLPWFSGRNTVLEEERNACQFENGEFRATSPKKCRKKDDPCSIPCQRPLEKPGQRFGARQYFGTKTLLRHLSWSLDKREFLSTKVLDLCGRVAIPPLRGARGVLFPANNGSNMAQRHPPNPPQGGNRTTIAPLKGRGNSDPSAQFEILCTADFPFYGNSFYGNSSTQSPPFSHFLCFSFNRPSPCSNNRKFCIQLTSMVSSGMAMPRGSKERGAFPAKSPLSRCR